MTSVPAQPRARTRDVDVLVVGGGPAGLATAALVARTGRSVELVEASERLGGMAASPVVAGQRVDLGSHRLHPNASAPAARLLRELLGDDLQVRPRRGRLRFAGRWVGFPLRTGDLLTSLPAATVLRLAAEQLTGPLRRPRQDTYQEVVRARLGPTVLAEFHGPYVAKLMGRPPDELAGELARRRIALRGPSDVAARLLRARTRAGSTFWYPRLGFGQIGERLAGDAEANGAVLRTGTTVTTLVPGGAPVVSTSGGDRLAPARVMWTAPPAALARVVPGAPSGAAGALEHRGVVLVHLVVERDRWSEWDAHYVGDRDVAFVRLSEPKNYRDGPDPTGQTVLCAELPASVGDARWVASDGDLVAEVLDGVRRLGLEPFAVAHAVTHRLASVYPVLTHDALAAADALQRWADGLDGVTVLGRQGRQVGDNLHHVLDMALAATACLGTGGRWDERAWRRACRGFDAHVVED